MSTFAAFSAPGRWFRGNCHTHTTLSDGKGTPQETAGLYRELGYDFLVLTDHWKCHAEVESLCRKGFLVIPGIELHPPAGAPNTVVPHHIVGIGVEHAPSKARMRKQTARAALRWIEREKGIAVYAHPYWSGHTIEHMREGRGAFGVEAFNNVCAVERGLGDASAHVDMALSAGIPWRIFAVDDLHSAQRDCGGGWIMVKSRELTRRSILKAIRRGHFYATQGPEIRSLRLERGTLRIECSPAKAIFWHTEGPFGRGAIGKDGPVTSAELSIGDRGDQTKYIRAEIIDAAGRKAWSNPIWFDRKRRRWTDELRAAR